MDMRFACIAGAVAALTMGVAAAAADDRMPPPWDRSDPFAVTLEWDFFSDANPLAPDGALTNLSNVNVDFPAAATISGDTATWESFTNNDGTEDGGWNFGDGGGAITFEVPNVRDLLPMKWLQIQITYEGQTPPMIGQVSAFDNVFGENVGIFRESVIDEPGYRKEHWVFEPNPDWEILVLEVPEFTFIDQIVIDSISIPSPGSVTLVGLAGLVALRRKRG